MDFSSMLHSLSQSLLLQELTEGIWPLDDPRVGPKESEASCPLCCPWDEYSAPSRAQSWESHVLLRTPWLEERWLNPMKASIQGSPTLLLLKTCISTYFTNWNRSKEDFHFMHKSKKRKQHSLFCIKPLQRRNRPEQRRARRAPSPGTALGISAARPSAFACV